MTVHFQASATHALLLGRIHAMHVFTPNWRKFQCVGVHVHVYELVHVQFIVHMCGLPALRTAAALTIHGYGVP